MLKMRYFALFFIAALVLRPSYALPVNSNGQCDDEQYGCGLNGGGPCIPLEWACDNVKDCANGRDESKCNYLHVCPDGDFMCKSGECVSANFKCDDRIDCSDGSDEAACPKKQAANAPEQNSSNDAPEFIKKVVCSLEDFRCEKSNKCIEKSKVCNGLADCEHMEDELGCVESCKNGGKKCSNNIGCYLNRCDGYPECSDGSDEEGCDYSELPSMDAFFGDHLHGCQKDEFKCPEGKCIPTSRLCDNRKDCENGEDESGLCGKCSSYECSYKCQDFPTGPQCYCPEGAFLSADFKTCETPNPCLKFGSNQCSQFCKPKGNSISCLCSDGYHLAENSSTDCEVNNEHLNGELFFTIDASSIRHNSIFNTSGSYYEEIVAAASRRISSISLRPDTDLIYFVAHEGLHSTLVYETCNSKDVPRKYLSALSLKDIAIDWVTGNIYYTAEGQYPGIGVCTPDGKYCRHLVDGEYEGNNRFTQIYGGLILHPARGLVIYVSYNKEHPEGVVRLVGMDGVNDRILSHEISRPKVSSIAMDYVRDYLFVGEEHSMVRYDLHTLKTEAVDNAPLAKSMLFFNGQFYFIGMDSKLRKAKIGSSAQDVIHILTDFDHALAINNSIYYNKTANPCALMSCSHICVLTEKLTAKCICPDQYKLNEQTGQCEPLDHHISRVKLSSDRMLSLCDNGTICQNGGSCRASYEDLHLISPACDCPPEFAGLYCEVPVYQERKEAHSSGWTTFFWMLLILIAVLVIAFYVITRIYPTFTDRLQHFFAFSPRTRRLNTFVDRIANSRASYSTKNAGGSSTQGANQAADPSKSSFINPVFGASPVLVKTNLDNDKVSVNTQLINFQSTALQKSPVEALNIDS